MKGSQFHVGPKHKLANGFVCLGLYVDDSTKPYFVVRLKTMVGWRVVLLSTKDLSTTHGAKVALADYGYFSSEISDVVTKLRQLAESRSKLPRLIVADGDGWYDPPRAYLFGSQLLGKPRTDIIQMADTTRSLQEVGTGVGVAEHGALKHWRQATREAVKRSDLLLLAICFGLAAPLLSPLGEKSWLVHFHGESGTGKTLALVVVRSLFGDPRQLANWNISTTAFEDALKVASDSPFVCDELTYMDKNSDAAKNLSRITYAIDANKGRSISRKSAAFDGRSFRRGRTIVLSNGEVSLAHCYAQSGDQRRRGEERRAFDIAVVTRPASGIFHNLPEGKEFRGFCRQVVEGCSANFGHAGRAFVEHLIESRIEWLDRVKKHARAFADSVSDSSNSLKYEQASRFGIAFAAGLEARRSGVIKCTRKRLKRVVAEYYRQSVQAASGDGAVLAQIRAKLLKAIAAGDRVYKAENCRSRIPADAIAIWRSTHNEYLVLAKFFRHLCGGSKPLARLVATSLRKDGFLKPGSNNNLTDQVPNIGEHKIRYYRISEEFISQRKGC